MIPNVDLRVKDPGTRFDTVTTFGRNISAHGVMLALRRKAPHRYVSITMLIGVTCQNRI